MWIGHEEVSPRGIRRVHRRHERLLGDGLQVGIQSESQVRTRHRCLHLEDLPPHDAPGRVLRDDGTAGLAAQDRVEGLLDTTVSLAVPR
jgi:hypothetical protein